MVDRAQLEAIVDRARLAPSVHNVQPTRWSLDPAGRILLLDRPDIRLPVADPDGRDIGISHGAALEGTLLALATLGWAGHLESMDGALAVIRAVPDTVIPSPMPEIRSRATWRDIFEPVPDTAALDRLEHERADLALVRAKSHIDRIATLADDASMHFLRDAAHRRELIRWMRLTRSHPDWSRDGLNAEAMALKPLEARVAKLVLGPLFGALDSVGLARRLLSEREKTTSASAVALFHRPKGESAMDTGRAFYSAWLAMERHGLAACPMSVLADWNETNRMLASEHRLPTDRALIGVFRLGTRPRSSSADHVRQQPGDLILSTT